MLDGRSWILVEGTEKKTFTGKELFGEKNDRLILVFSRKKEDVARVVWMFKDNTQKEWSLLMIPGNLRSFYS